MAKRELNPSDASRLLSEFIKRHLARGTGNDGEVQSAATLARRADVSESRLSDLSSRIGGLPSSKTLDALERGFFPHGSSANNVAWLEWSEVRQAIANDGLPPAIGYDDKRYTTREAWDLLMRPLADRIIPLVRSASEGFGALNSRNIDARTINDAFILPMPDWFIDEIRGDDFLRSRYDIHLPIDLTGAADLAHLYNIVPVPNFRAMVTYHAEAHAHAVLAGLRQRSAFPPYNKKKLGLHSYEQSQRAGQDEGVYLDLDFFETDYHTHRVMKRVLRDLRASDPALFRDETDPYAALPWLAYFTTSFGINLVATTQEERGRRFYMTRLSNRQGNLNQQGLWHISGNEGVNCEDVHDGRIDMGPVVARTLKEELGTIYAEGDETIWLEFAIDRRNLEPFLSCIVHLAANRETFYRRKRLSARDDRREFANMQDFPFTEEAIVRLLIQEPTGSEAFTSYGLNILDSILLRGLAPKVAR